MSKLRIEFQSAIFFQVGVVEQCLLLVSRATSSSPPSQNPPKNRKLRRQQRIGDYPISLLFCVSRGRIMPRLVDWCWFIFLWRNWFRAAKNRRFFSLFFVSPRHSISFRLDRQPQTRLKFWDLELVGSSSSRLLWGFFFLFRSSFTLFLLTFRWLNPYAEASRFGNRKHPRASTIILSNWANILGKSPQQILVSRSALWGGEPSEGLVLDPWALLRCQSPSGSNGRFSEELGIN